MDWCLFLSSLPFVIPIQSQSWPPPIPPSSTSSTTTTTTTTKKPPPTQTLTGRYSTTITKSPARSSTLVNNDTTTGNISSNNNTSDSKSTLILSNSDKYNRSFFISVEFCNTTNNNNNTSLLASSNKYDDTTTAFFKHSSISNTNSNTNTNSINNNHTTTTSTKVNDIAMANIQLATIERRLNSNNFNKSGFVGKLPATTTTTTQSSASSSNQRYMSNGQPGGYQNQYSTIQSSGQIMTFTILYMYICNSIYVLDVNQIRSIQIIPEEYVNDTNTTTTTTQTQTITHCTNNDDDDYFYGSSTIGKMNRRRVIKKPPSLVLLFDNGLLFRIFTTRPTPPKTINNNNSNTTTNTLLVDIANKRSPTEIKEEIETLQLIYDTINQIQVQNQHVPKSKLSFLLSTFIASSCSFQSSTGGVNGGSSSGGTTSSSNTSSATPILGGQQLVEQQQLNNSTSSSNEQSKIASVPIQENTTTDVVDDDVDNNDNDSRDIIPFPPCIKRRKLNQDKLHDHLSMLQQILDSPPLVIESIVSSSSSSSIQAIIQQQQQQQQQQQHNMDDDDASNRNNLPIDALISILLKSIAELQKRSYVPKHDLDDNAVQYYNTLVQTNHTELEQALNELFPSHRAMYNAIVKKEQSSKITTIATGMTTNTMMNHQESGTATTNASRRLPTLANDVPIDPSIQHNNQTLGGTEQQKQQQDNGHQSSIHTIGQLLAKHKSIMTERYKLFLMSTRV